MSTDLPPPPDSAPALRHLDEGLWTVDHPLRVGLLAIGSRMTIVRLSDGGLFLHSPVPLPPPLHAALEGEGPVRHVVAPNRLHHLFLADAARAFPGAEAWVAPGLPAKRRDLPAHRVLGDATEAAWKADLEQHLVEGAPALSEVVFFHRATRTLLLTDLAFHVRRAPGLLTRLFWRANGALGRFGPTRMVRLVLRDRAAVRRSLDRILAWDFERVTLTHGEVLERGGRQALREAYAFL